jgi:hypothetical protein
LLCGESRKNTRSLGFPAGFIVVGNEFKFSVEGIRKVHHMLGRATTVSYHSDWPLA